MGVLDGLPRGFQAPLSGALKDLRSIAESVKEIPRLAELLSDIADHTARLDEEVREMRAEVVKIRIEVAEMSTSVEGKLDEVGGALHPLRRTLGRFNRNDRDEDPSED